METPTQNTGVESSPAPPAVAEVPAEGPAYDHWRRTGEVKPKAESAPAKKSSDAKPADAGEGEGDQASGNAADSETENQTERKPSKAERRLNELLEDLKRAGLSPAELKTFKREAQKAEATEKPKEAAPERTDKAPAELKPPAKPKADDFKTWEEYEEARDKYFEELADFKAQSQLAKYQLEQRQTAAQKAMQERLDAAKQRYGEDADQTIISAAKEIFTGDAVPGVIREVLNESKVLVDVLYTIGSKPEELAEFLDLCKTSPGQALRKAVLIEKLVGEELGKPAKSESATDRDESGKFVSSKKETKAPPPPRETSGRSSAPPDPVTGAVERGDFAAYRDAANRRDLAARRGQ